MIQPIALSPAEIQLVTGYKLAKKQIEALALMEIPFKVRPNGTPYVARVDSCSQVIQAQSQNEAVLTLI